MFAGVRRDGDAATLPGSGNVVPVVFDVTDEGSVAAAAESVHAATDHSGGLHGLVNAAGMIVQGPLELVSTRALRQQFEVNVFGPMTVIRAFLPALRRGRGRIVNVGAATGRVTVPFAGPISASKTAIESLSDALRMELKHLGIRVAVVEPGAMETEIFAKADRYAIEDLQTASPRVRALYEPAMKAVANAFDNAKPSSPDVAVDAVIKAMTDRSPDTRYLAGRDARMLNRLRRMPDGLRDRMLMRTLGLRADLFAPSEASTTNELSPAGP